MKFHIIAVAVSFVLQSAAAAFAQPIATTPPNNYGDGKSWLCHPGRPDTLRACDADLRTTIIAADGTSTVESWKPDPRAAIDCFYVYPTVSTDPNPNSDMRADPAELNVVRLQFARFGANCRLYAPLYRQVTLAAVRDAVAIGTLPNVMGLGYDDIREAWNYYLEHDNKGRPFVLIGHSQGAAILRELVRREIDGQAIQTRLVSALLIGIPVAMPLGKDMGGSFANVPVCRAPSQTGCVIAYSSFRSTAPPPPNTLFGRVQDRTMVAACTNPAALDGGEGHLRSYFDAKGRILVDVGPSKPWMFRNKPISTPFVSVIGLLTARCASNENATYLEISLHQGSIDLNTKDIQGDGPAPSWGLHGVDMELAMGNLVDLVGRQSKAFFAKRGSR